MTDPLKLAEEIEFSISAQTDFRLSDADLALVAAALRLAEARRDLIVKINRERADAGCVIYDLTEKRKTDAAEIARLRAAVERLTRDRDLAERKAAVCREDAEINARRAESAESRVAELEAAAWELFQAFDGTDVALQARMLDNLRALLAPREPKSCGECGGSGYVWDGPAGVHISDGNAMKPCPACRGGEETK